MFRAEPPWGESLKVIAVVLSRLTNSPAARAISQLFLCLRGAPIVHPRGTNKQRLRQPDGASASVARELDMVLSEFGVWGGCLPGGCGCGPGSEICVVRSGFGARGGYLLRGRESGLGSEICVVRSEIGARGEKSLRVFRGGPGSETGLVRSEVGVRGEHSLRGFRSGCSWWGSCFVSFSTALRLSAGRRAGGLTKTNKAFSQQAAAPSRVHITNSRRAATLSRAHNSSSRRAAALARANKFPTRQTAVTAAHTNSTSRWPQHLRGHLPPPWQHKSRRLAEAPVRERSADRRPDENQTKDSP